MKPVDQPHAQLLTAPGCFPPPAVLVTYADGVQAVVTAWELTEEEVADVVKTGRLWLEVRGITQPPVVLATRCPYGDDPTLESAPESPPLSPFEREIYASRADRDSDVIA